MTEITLRRSGGQWLAHHSGDGAAYLTNLMGSADIPTPYRDTAQPDVVLAEIKRLNPDDYVHLDEWYLRTRTATPEGRILDDEDGAHFTTLASSLNHLPSGRQPDVADWLREVHDAGGFVKQQGPPFGNPYTFDLFLGAGGHMVAEVLR